MIKSDKGTEILDEYKRLTAEGLLALADRMRANDCTPMAVQGALDLADAATIAEG